MRRPVRIAYLAASTLSVVGGLTGRDRLQWAGKPVMMPLLAADVLAAGDRIAPGDRRLLLGSLAAATVGDVVLIAPDDERRLVAGASAFAVMQAGYSALWWRRGARPRAAVALPRVATWLGAAALLAIRAPRIAIALSAYGATLTTAGILASDPGVAPGAKTVAGMVLPDADPRSRLGLGALLFTFSDGLIVARRLFARTSRSRRISEGVILASYAAAQSLLADPRVHER